MISLLAPTRNRPDWALRMWESAQATAVGDIELVLYVDDDDPSLSELDAIEDATIVIGDRCVLSDTWNRAYAKAEGNIVMQAADDLVFRSHGWDKAVAEAFPHDGIALVYGRDGYQDEKLATHGFVTRKWVETVGYFLPPWFVSDYSDLWIDDVAEKIGRRVFLPEVYIEHMHPDAGKAELDRTHRERLERHKRDDPGRLYASLANDREMDAVKLAQVMA